MTNTQRAAMQQAIDALAEFTGSMTVGQRYSNAGQMALDALPLLRDALADPVVKLPLLRIAEIREVADKADEGQEPTEYMLAFAYAVEKAVLRKVGIK